MHGWSVQITVSQAKSLASRSLLTFVYVLTNVTGPLQVNNSGESFK